MSDTEQQATQLCCDCKQRKPLGSFYRNRAKSNGRGARCKECDRARRPDPADQARWQRDYARRHPDRIAAKERRRRKAEPEKVAAREALRAAIKLGRIKRRSTCENCGEADGVEAHHDDYSQPFEVEWLCRECHFARHGKTLHAAESVDGQACAACGEWTRGKWCSECDPNRGAEPSAK